MHFILVAFLMNVQSGVLSGYERVGTPFDTPEECVKVQEAQPIQKATNGGGVKVFLCVREDQLHEVTT
jgi:hypothetical protein